MKDEDNQQKGNKKHKCECKCGCRKGIHNTCKDGAVYGFGFIGALVYFIGTAPTFWAGALGVLKAIIWPAMLVYHLLKYLGL